MDVVLNKQCFGEYQVWTPDISSPYIDSTNQVVQHVRKIFYEYVRE